MARGRCFRWTGRHPLWPQESVCQCYSRHTGNVFFRHKSPSGNPSNCLEALLSAWSLLHFGFAVLQSNKWVGLSLFAALSLRGVRRAAMASFSALLCHAGALLPSSCHPRFLQFILTTQMRDDNKSIGSGSLPHFIHGFDDDFKQVDVKIAREIGLVDLPVSL